jgi:hypothetical protein
LGEIAELERPMLEPDHAHQAEGAARQVEPVIETELNVDPVVTRPVARNDRLGSDGWTQMVAK